MTPKSKPNSEAKSTTRKKMKPQQGTTLKALQVAEVRAQAMLSAIPDLMFRMDRQGVFIDYKADIHDLYASTDIIGKHNRDLTPPEFADLIDEKIRITLETGTLQTFEYQLPISDRGMRYYEARMTPSGTDEVTAIVRDITDRKLVEEKLRESEERYQRITKAITDYIYTVQVAGGQVIKTSHGPGCLAVTGYTAQEFDADPFLWLKMVALEDQPLVKEQARRIMGGEAPPPIEHQITHKSGTVRWVKNTFVPHLDEHGNLVSYDGLIQDITERKRAEEALKRSEAFARSIIENEPECIKIVGEGGILKYMNPAGLAMIEVDDLARVVGKSVYPIIVPQYREAFIELTERVLRGEHGNLQFEIVGLKGTQRWLDTHAVPLFDAQGKVEGLLGLTQDITAHKRAEEEIRQLNTTLEQRVEERTRELREAQAQLMQSEKLAVLGQLAGGVGYELRNPLGIISNAVYFLKLALPDAGDKIKEYLNYIERETRAAEKIITDLLDFARVKPVERAPVSASELIHKTLERFPVPETIRVALDLPEGLPQAYVDIQEIIEVLGNLTLNACDAMAVQGGTLTFSARAQDDLLRLTVQDTGVGIPAENMQKLFEPLFSTKPKGIGLGLAVSKKLIAANGGSIQVESEVGVGSRFQIDLPVNKDL